MNVSLPPFLTTDFRVACHASDPELFFPDGYGLQYKDQIEEAKTLCASCPVRDLCLSWAAPITDLDGIWAGTTPPERRRIRTGKPLPSEQHRAA
jgi:WhiB family redox-sensing transcriptional regulator